MAASGDPLGAGVIAGLAHPGENVTGLSALTAEVSGKRLSSSRTRCWSPPIASCSTWGILQSRRNGRTSRSRLDPCGFSHNFLTSVGAKIWSAPLTRDQAAREAVMVGLGTVAQSNVGRVVDLSVKHGLPLFYSRESSWTRAASWPTA